jgi:quercetin 2,3-dioxygenase
MQLWIAQPEDTRHGEPAFDHLGDLPQVELRPAVLTVRAGSFAGAASPARSDTPLVGADAVLGLGTTTWPLRADFEYGLTV